MPRSRSRTQAFSKSPKPVHSEQENGRGEWLRDLILGGQDGLVNVLGLVLGVATATSDSRIVIVAGLAAMFAEGISMGAVAYTSSKASLEYYARERKREAQEIVDFPSMERNEVRKIYAQKGFRGGQLDAVVSTLTANKERWLNVMMEEELKLEKPVESPLQSAVIVAIAALIGAIFPIIPYFFMPVAQANQFTVPFSLIVLFIAGAAKGKYTKVPWWRSGLELSLIGIGAALIGFLIGSALSVPI